ncbi:hypothetical protein [Oceanirhabdus seepicola]|uniref:Uncharacterized protein n=1 Tax=Oceanirhabdus seepicola TaxID=2828781 RepID=A0A9J6P048_9CLOT|nr:hypothetical protein [Oceanirhabdus seepicola]MCM1988792.1 hypothetical protein [Oceanirhabdus seepicola]
MNDLRIYEITNIVNKKINMSLPKAICSETLKKRLTSFIEVCEKVEKKENGKSIYSFGNFKIITDEVEKVIVDVKGNINNNNMNINQIKRLIQTYLKLGLNKSGVDENEKIIEFPTQEEIEQMIKELNFTINFKVLASTITLTTQHDEFFVEIDEYKNKFLVEHVNKLERLDVRDRKKHKMHTHKQDIYLSFKEILEDVKNHCRYFTDNEYYKEQNEKVL